jgi:hypothetical protein
MVKRRHPRVPLNQPVNLDSAGTMGQGTTVNFSPGGCAIQQRDLSLFCGRRLTMRLALPDCPEPLDVGQVVVAWTKDHHCGIRFLATSQEVQERLSQVYELLVKAQTEAEVSPIISLAPAISR